MTKTEKRIIDFVGSNPGVPRAEITRVLGITGGTLSRALKRLRVRGKIPPTSCRMLLSVARGPRECPDEQRIVRLLRRDGPLIDGQIIDRLVKRDRDALDIQAIRDALSKLTWAGVISSNRAIYLRGQ